MRLTAFTCTMARFPGNASKRSGVASYDGWPGLASRVAQRFLKPEIFAPICVPELAIFATVAPSLQVVNTCNS